ncbi:hypothetical protein, partial [Brasilonema sp. UFV-L1]|uniref:hypothetical protein n=1 Tax=Brasilonema sp. UFV-L1 TaxID=2234130 RepID=UPI0016B64FCB
RQLVYKKNNFSWGDFSGGTAVFRALLAQPQVNPSLSLALKVLYTRFIFHRQKWTTTNNVYS